jgi:hypothetical protein
MPAFTECLVAAIARLQSILDRIALFIEQEATVFRVETCKEGSMKRVHFRSWALGVTLVLAMLVPIAGIDHRTLLAQSPEAESGCGAGSAITEKGEMLAPGVTRQSSTVTFVPVGTAVQFAIASIVCIDPDTPILVETSPDIQVFGIAAITVLEGSLDVTLVKPCTGTASCTVSGIARVGRLAADNTVTWTDLTAGGPAETLELGDTAIFENVTIHATSGPSQTIIGTVGTQAVSGGGGCPGACYQFP